MRKECLILLSLVMASCHMLGLSDVSGNADEYEGQLRIAFASVSDGMTRVLSELPDTSEFILTVCDQDGNSIYSGPYGDSPESIMVKQGNYTVKVVSQSFDKPAFSTPQFGDEQCVVISAGEVANVRLLCRQLNCGIRLNIDRKFLTLCPDGVLFLTSEEGKLMYSYSEKRIAYFKPGNISLMLSRSGKDEVLMTRQMSAQEILTLGVSMASSDHGGNREKVSVSVDTSRVWINDDFVIGGDNGKGTDADAALTVSQAMSSVGQEDVWVSGYVVGGDLTSSSASYTKPFSSKTCLLLGPRSSTTDRTVCMSVQLPAGEVRDALNLVDNPGLLGRKICIKGDVSSSYYGLVGLKNSSDFKL